MKEVFLKFNGVEVVFITGGSIITLLFGDWTGLMTTLLILQVADIFTGVLKSSGREKKEDRLGSTPFYVGIKKKVGMWVLIILANAIDGIAFGGMPVAKTGVTSFLIAGEGLSIVENLADLGVHIPESVTKYLSQLKQDNDSDDLTKK